MARNPSSSNLKPVVVKMSSRPAARTNAAAKPRAALASGLTPAAMKVFALAKARQKEQAAD